MIWKLSPRWFNRLVALSIFAAVLGGCASTPDPLPAAVLVEGNGNCRPPSDLPPKKTMKKVPAVEATIQKLYDLLLGERKDHAKDVQDYNSLYEICVNGKTISK